MSKKKGRIQQARVVKSGGKQKQTEKDVTKPEQGFLLFLIKYGTVIGLTLFLTGTIIAFIF